MEKWFCGPWRAHKCGACARVVQPGQDPPLDDKGLIMKGSWDLSGDHWGLHCGDSRGLFGVIGGSLGSMLTTASRHFQDFWADW